MKMEEWKECKLGDLVTVKGGKRLPKGINLISTKNSHPYIRIRDLGKSKYLQLNSDYEYVDDETQKSISRYITNKGDVLISIVGTIGLIGIVGESLDNANLTENCVKLIDLKNIDSNYLYYFLSSEIGQNEIKKGTVGAVQPKLPIKNIQDIDIPIPPLPTQQKIATILSSLDDKIELNNKINTNLEQQAQALFKNWFVDFEPFGGKIPEGWKVGKLSDVAEIKTDTFKPEQNPDIQVEHYSLPAFDEKRYPTFEISKELKSNKFIISNDEVLVSKLNPTVKRVWRPYCLIEKSICSTEFIVYKPTSAELKDYLFSIVNSSEFNDFMCSNVTGSTNSHQRTPPKTTLNYEIPIPTKDILHKFCNIVTPMYDKIKENIKQNETVSSLRDTLLPKLMNGEIEVDKVEL